MTKRKLIQSSSSQKTEVKSSQSTRRSTRLSSGSLKQINEATEEKASSESSRQVDSEESEEEPEPEKKKKVVQVVIEKAKEPEAVNENEGSQPKKTRKVSKHKSDFNLFEMIQNGKGSTQVIIEQWSNEFILNPQNAIQFLVNLVLLVSGSSTEIESLDVEPETAFNDLVIASGESLMTSKKKEMKKGKTLYLTFWRNLLETVEKSILTNSDFLPVLIPWLVVMTGSQFRVVRIAATHAALGLVSGINKVLNSEKAKKKLGKPMTAPQIQKLNELLQSTFNSVFIHRYRDVDQHIRLICVEELSMWIQQSPDTFLENSYLRYVCWAMSDLSQDVRLLALNILTELFSNADFIETIKAAIERFKSRVIEVALKDVDEDVRKGAITLCEDLITNGVLTKEEILSLKELATCSSKKIQESSSILASNIVQSNHIEKLLAEKKTLPFSKLPTLEAEALTRSDFISLKGIVLFFENLDHEKIDSSVRTLSHSMKVLLEPLTIIEYLLLDFSEYKTDLKKKCAFLIKLEESQVKVLLNILKSSIKLLKEQKFSFSAEILTKLGHLTEKFKEDGDCLAIVCETVSILGFESFSNVRLDDLFSKLVATFKQGFFDHPSTRLFSCFTCLLHSISISSSSVNQFDEIIQATRKELLESLKQPSRFTFNRLFEFSKYFELLVPMQFLFDNFDQDPLCIKIAYQILLRNLKLGKVDRLSVSSCLDLATRNLNENNFPIIVDILTVFDVTIIDESILVNFIKSNLKTNLVSYSSAFAKLLLKRKLNETNLFLLLQSFGKNETVDELCKLTIEMSKDIQVSSFTSEIFKWIVSARLDSEQDLESAIDLSKTLVNHLKGLLEKNSNLDSIVQFFKNVISLISNTISHPKSMKLFKILSLFSPLLTDSSSVSSFLDSEMSKHKENLKGKKSEPLNLFKKTLNRKVGGSKNKMATSELTSVIDEANPFTESEQQEFPSSPQMLKSKKVSME